jgi:microcystin-dependent protein
MAWEPFLGEIRIFAGGVVPKGWALCDGQLLAISEHEALFGVLGATYGGDGQTTFALPDLRGRVPIDAGSGYALGQRGGSEAHTLTPEETPAHTHTLLAAAENGRPVTPAGTVLAPSFRGFNDLYGDPTQTVTMGRQALAPAGGGQPHENVQPSLALIFIIAIEGDQVAPH